MTNEELLSVAEIVEKLTDRFNAQAALHRERFDEHVKLIASMKADHEAKMVEHRAAFGARTEADAQLITKLQNMVREQSNSANDAGEMLGWTANESAIQAVERVVKERDGLLTQVQDMRAEITRLTALRPKYKVGDKLQLYPAIRYTPVTVVGVRTVYDCQADGAEYPVGHSEDELTERYEQTAYHDTEAGKASAESAVKTEPVAEEIKVGDMAKVVGASGDLTAQSDIGKIGEVLKIDFGDGTVLLSGGAGWVDHRDVRKVTT